ncbi:hypothetical protein QYF36_017549 [Acer negundo]|nr:hypothetical protein QYF36_017549 [Acer negundo]
MSRPGRKPLHCSYCDQDLHTKETCYKLHDYLEGHRLYKPNKPNVNRNKRVNLSANNVKTRFSMQELQTVMPNISQGQYQQILSIMTEQETEPQTSQANVATLSTVTDPLDKPSSDLAHIPNTIDSDNHSSSDIEPLTESITASLPFPGPQIHQSQFHKTPSVLLKDFICSQVTLPSTNRASSSLSGNTKENMYLILQKLHSRTVVMRVGCIEGVSWFAGMIAPKD